MSAEDSKLQSLRPVSNSEGAEFSAKKKPENPYIYDGSNCLADWLYLYAKRIVDVGNSKSFSPEDMCRLNEHWTYKEMYPKFLLSYKDLTNKGWSFKASFYGAFLWRICYALGQWLVGSLVGLIAPIYVKKLIYWMRHRDDIDPSPASLGWYYGFMMILTVMVRLILKRRSQFESVILGFEVGQCMRGLVYNKFETLSTEAIRNLDIGRLSNTISSDVGQIQLALRMIQVLVVTPVVLIVVSIYLLVEFGWFALTIPVVFSLVIAMQFFINKFTTRYIAKKRELADKRTKFVGEVLMGIKNIKFQAWEDIAVKKIEDIRAEEVGMLGKYISLRGHTFNLEDTALFTGFVGQMIGPMRMLTQSLDRLNSANISLGRIEKVIKTVDAVPKHLPKGTVAFQQFTGGWYSKEQTDYFLSNQDKVDTVAVRDIDMTFEAGKLYAVLGEVGSGKSSLLLAALQDLVTKQGSIDLHGQIAYVPQNAFLLNASIKDNIVFGQPYDEARYKDTVVSCCLLDDLKQLPGGDRTEVGERGINLSGGQKQRIAIARALYAKRDIYLVDDCLSALDAEVGKRIFFDVIKKRLQGKTVIMVTHATNILSLCDSIVLMKNGRVSISGHYDKIKSHRDFNEYFRSQQKPHSRKSSTTDLPNTSPNLAQAADQEVPAEIPATSTLEPPADTHREELKQLETLYFSLGQKGEDKLKAKGALTKKEGRNKGLVQLKYLWMYCDVYGRSLFVMFVAAVAICTALRILSDYWVGFWAKGSAQGGDISVFDEKQIRGANAFYFSWHLVINIVLLSLIVCRSTVHSRGIMTASFTISQRLTRGVLRNTLEYFDTTPVGVIINRFTKDIDIMDSNLAHFISQFMGNFFIVLETLALMVLTIIQHAN